MENSRVQTHMIGQMLGPFGSLEFHGVGGGGDLGHNLFALSFVDELKAENANFNPNLNFLTCFSKQRASIDENVFFPFYPKTFLFKKHLAKNVSYF